MRAQFSTKLQALFEHDGMMQVESPRDLLFVCSEVAKLTKAFILKEQKKRFCLSETKREKIDFFF